MTQHTPAKLEWADPADYAGQPVCARCGKDENGTEWPNCMDLLPKGPRSIRREVCQMTCAVYWDHGDMWLCPECDAIVGDGSDG